MPDLTVAQNIFIGREPRGGRASCRRARRLNAQAPQLIERLHLPLDPNELRRQPHGRQAADGGDRARRCPTTPKLLIMDEPTAALNDAEVDELLRTDPPLRAPERGHHLHLAPMDELQADRRPRHGDARRRYVGTRSDGRDADRTRSSRMMVGRELSARRAGRRPGASRRGRARGLGAEHAGPLVRDVSFDLRKGEILGFAGLMGAGRTEVARAVVGADQATPARSGCTAARSDPQPRRRRRATGSATCPRTASGSACCSAWTSRRNIGLASLRTVPRSAASSRTKAMRADRRASYVRTLRIKTPSVAQPVKNLSGGNQQKVVIAKWLDRGLRHPDLRRADPRHRRRREEEIYQLLNELARQGKSIIMISSELPEILRMTHRIVVMSEGRITGELAPAEATQESVMTSRPCATRGSGMSRTVPAPEGAIDAGAPASSRGVARSRPATRSSSSSPSRA